MKRGTRTAVAVASMAMMTAPVAAAASAVEPVVWEAQAGNCSLSYAPTAADGTAYFVLEAGPAVSCQLEVGSVDAGTVLADVTTVSTMAVVYVAAAGEYSYSVTDMTADAVASGVVQFTGSPREPDLGPNVNLTGECALSLEPRDVIGTFASWETGFIVSQNAGAPNCAHDVASDPQAPTQYTATIARNLGQVAVLSPFGIELDKRVTGPGGEGVSQARVGEALTYTFTVTNTGYVPWEFAITDALEGLEPITCDTTVLAPQSSVTCTAGYTVTTADADAGVVTNVATATGVDSVRPRGATGVGVTTAPASIAFTVAPHTPTPTPTPTESPMATPAHPEPSPTVSVGDGTVTVPAHAAASPSPRTLAGTGGSAPFALLAGAGVLAVIGAGALTIGSTRARGSRAR